MRDASDRWFDTYDSVIGELYGRAGISLTDGTPYPGHGDSFDLIAAHAATHAHGDVVRRCAKHPEHGYVIRGHHCSPCQRELSAAKCNCGHERGQHFAYRCDRCECEGFVEVGT